jgi:hypothetical protein
VAVFILRVTGFGTADETFDLNTEPVRPTALPVVHPRVLEHLYFATIFFGTANEACPCLRAWPLADVLAAPPVALAWSQIYTYIC